jgi:hypothetical protein
MTVAAVRFIRDPKPGIPFEHIICVCLDELDTSNAKPGQRLACHCGCEWIVDGGWLESLEQVDGR